ncbi:MAG TPA: histidine phosphatase family protein [Candidatus Limnocylindrales bacterium]|nr:histidine phosphatase family protein [Candidatus Limnocylindrales bacterium]
MIAEAWLVRHASTAWTGSRWLGNRDLPLTAVGRAEATAAARRLAAIVPAGTVVMSSPARRAIETAAPIAERLRVRVRVDPDLREVDVGLAEGLTWDEVRRDLPDVAAALIDGRPVDWPGGESATALRSRVGNAWGRIAARREPAVIVVGHAGVIAAIVASLLPRNDSMWLGPASAVRVRLASGAWQIDPAEPGS